MPEFGDEKRILALKLSADASASFQTVFRSISDDYTVEEGYIIKEVIPIVTNEKGPSTLTPIEFSNYPHNLEFDYGHFEGEFDFFVGWLKDEYLLNEKIKRIYHALKFANEHTKWARTFWTKVGCRAEPFSTAKKEVEFYVDVIYVGNLLENFFYKVKSLVSGITVHKIVPFNQFVDYINFSRVKNHSINGDTIIANNISGELSNPSIFFDCPEVPYETIAKFNAYVGTAGKYKTFECVIWKLIYQHEPQPISGGRMSIDNWDYISCETDDTGFPLRFEIYWHDHLDEDTLIDLSKTYITLTKTWGISNTELLPDHFPFVNDSNSTSVQESNDLLE